MSTALALVGGWAHPADETGPPLRAALTEIGLDVDMVDHPDALPEAMADQDLLVVHGCFFEMKDRRYDKTQRRRFAYTTSPELRDAIDGWVRSARPILAMHTAVLCFDDWPRWSGYLGAGWDWDRSYHPPPGPMTVRFTADLHPMVEGLEDFEVVDERYTNLVVSPDVDVFAVTDGDRTEGEPDQPVVWLHSGGAIRVVYDALGHGPESLDNPDHLEMLAKLVDTMLGWPTLA